MPSMESSTPIFRSQSNKKSLFLSFISSFPPHCKQTSRVLPHSVHYTATAAAAGCSRRRLPKVAIARQRRVLLVTRVTAWCRAGHCVAILEAHLTLAALAGPPLHRAFAPYALFASSLEPLLLVAVSAISSSSSSCWWLLSLYVCF
ncbi:hypothetical protein Syun_021732 [Stephania yunnanensis]|uniref:Uncharacterized protein n=1 Tax=Stephania yunnanensis TaxID=152371 RepID=A0AAP0IGL8_9MAGN